MENNKPYWELLKDEPKEKQDEFYAGLERLINNAESKKYVIYPLHPINK